MHWLYWGGIFHLLSVPALTRFFIGKRFLSSFQKIYRVLVLLFCYLHIYFSYSAVRILFLGSNMTLILWCIFPAWHSEIKQQNNNHKWTNTNTFQMMVLFKHKSIGKIHTNWGINKMIEKLITGSLPSILVFFFLGLDSLVFTFFALESLILTFLFFFSVAKILPNSMLKNCSSYGRFSPIGRNTKNVGRNWCGSTYQISKQQLKCHYCYSNNLRKALSILQAFILSSFLNLFCEMCTYRKN